MTPRSSLLIAEVGLLFAALFCALPLVPSDEIERVPLLPGGALAVALFLGSRIIRWGKAYPIAFVEAVLFAAFVWGLNEVANILHAT